MQNVWALTAKPDPDRPQETKAEKRFGTDTAMAYSMQAHARDSDVRGDFELQRATSIETEDRGPEASPVEGIHKPDELGFGAAHIEGADKEGDPYLTDRR